MEFELDLERIGRLAAEKHDENLAFVALLKAHADSQLLDALAECVLSEVVSLVDCTECGNCCMKPGAAFAKPELESIAAAAKVRWAANGPKPGVPEDAGADKASGGRAPCPLLEGKRCSAYEQRPQCCRDYPHLEAEDLLSRLERILPGCAICPIIYNVYERLKNELWTARPEAYRVG